MMRILSVRSRYPITFTIKNICNTSIVSRDIEDILRLHYNRRIRVIMLSYIEGIKADRVVDCFRSDKCL